MAVPPPAPGLPGPFSCVAIGDQLEAAGFGEVEVRRVPAPLRLESAAECALLERESFGALHQMLGGLDAEAQAAVWGEVTERLSAFESAEGFVGPCELVVVAGTEPANR